MSDIQSEIEFTLALPRPMDLSDVRVRERVEARAKDLWETEEGRRWECVWPMTSGPVDEVVAITSRPLAAVVYFPDGIKSAEGQKVAADIAAEGFSIVEYDPVHNQAIAALLDPLTAKVRERIREAFGAKDPWDVEIAVRWGTHGGRRYMRDLLILRAPKVEESKRRDVWSSRIKDIMPPLPGFVWRYRQEEMGAVHLEQAEDLLNKMFPFDEDVTTFVAPTTPWHVGVDEDGEEVLIDVAGSAHMLIAGATRSGKSVSTYGLITHILRMGPCAQLLVEVRQEPHVGHCRAPRSPPRLREGWRLGPHLPEPHRRVQGQPRREWRR